MLDVVVTLHVGWSTVVCCVAVNREGRGLPSEIEPLYMEGRSELFQQQRVAWVKGAVLERLIRSERMVEAASTECKRRVRRDTVIVRRCESQQSNRK